MQLPLKPFFHLPPPTMIEVILPRGTPTSAAVAAGGRAVSAIRELVARPVEVKVEAREMQTSLQLWNVETVPFRTDARGLMDAIYQAIGG